ncbi:hypothetical protein ES705_35093 [subsurface metagenome]
MSNIKLFESKQIRSVWNDEEKKWYFVVEDVVAVLTDSKDPKQYVKRMKLRDKELAKGWVQIVPTLLIDTSGGKQKMSCANTEGLFRIIQSIPSPKAEPFKRWLAKVGYERLEEIENPELASKRAREIYKAKGYSDDWIEKRIRSIAIRDELTDEWEKRGVRQQIEYAISFLFKSIRFLAFSSAKVTMRSADPGKGFSYPSKTSGYRRSFANPHCP